MYVLSVSTRRHYAHVYVEPGQKGYLPPHNWAAQPLGTEYFNIGVWIIPGTWDDE